MFAVAELSQAASRHRRLIAALCGAASLVAGVSQGNAQVQSGDTQRIANQMAKGAASWQQELRDHLSRSGGGSGAVVERARDVFQAYNQICAADGAACASDIARNAVQVAARAACAAQVVAVAIDPDYVPPRGSIGYDFQPVGGRTANGFRPVVPGDPRLTGGSQVVTRGTKDSLTDDALSGVMRFRGESPGNGEYRVILIGAADQGSTANPFGNQLLINGRTVDVTLGVVGKGVALGQNNDGVRGRVAGTDQAPMLVTDVTSNAKELVQVPMLVIDVTIDAKELDVQFSNGGTVAGLMLEPVSGVSALGPSVAASTNGSSAEQCSSAEAQIQKAASDGNVVAPTKTAAPVPGPGPSPPPPFPPPPSSPQPAVLSGN